MLPYQCSQKVATKGITQNSQARYQPIPPRIRIKVPISKKSHKRSSSNPEAIHKRFAKMHEDAKIRSAKNSPPTF